MRQIPCGHPVARAATEAAAPSCPYFSSSTGTTRFRLFGECHAPFHAVDADEISQLHLPGRHKVRQRKDNVLFNRAFSNAAHRTLPSVPSSSRKVLTEGVQLKTNWLFPVPEGCAAAPSEFDLQDLLEVRWPQHIEHDSLVDAVHELGENLRRAASTAVRVSFSSMRLSRCRASARTPDRRSGGHSSLPRQVRRHKICIAKIDATIVPSVSVACRESRGAIARARRWPSRSRRKQQGSLSRSV